MYGILMGAWRLRHLKCFPLTWRGRRGPPYPAPSKEGALPLYGILMGAWRLRHLKCFPLTWRGRRGPPYPAPSKEGGLPLCKISATAWSPRHRKRFTPMAWPPRRALPGPDVCPVLFYPLFRPNPMSKKAIPLPPTMILKRKQPSSRQWASFFQNLERFSVKFHLY